MTDGESWITLDQNVDPSGQIRIGPPCERACSDQGEIIDMPAYFYNGPCELIRAGIN